MTQKDLLSQYRDFLKTSIRKRIDFSQTAQSLGAALPPIEKPCAPGAKRIDLPKPDRSRFKAVPLFDAVAARRSRRAYTGEAISLGELGFLAWATQGLRGKVTEGHAYRTVPSAGCRHALETYLLALNVEGLEPAIYRYLPLSHQIVLERTAESLGMRIAEAASSQSFLAEASVVFVWAAVPYRMEWRYGLASHKAIALDAGHVCQNLYLACEAIGAGTCAIGAYDQEATDAVLGLDGEEEFVIYMAPVGRIRD